MSTVQMPRRAPRAVLTIIAWIGLAVALALTTWLIAPDHHSGGGCTGIGFGCSPSPQDTVLFTALVLGLPLALGISIFGPLFVAVVERRRLLPRLGPVALGTTATIAGVVTTACVAVLLMGVLAAL